MKYVWYLFVVLFGVCGFGSMFRFVEVLVFTQELKWTSLLIGLLFLSGAFRMLQRARAAGSEPESDQG